MIGSLAVFGTEKPAVFTWRWSLDYAKPLLVLGLAGAVLAVLGGPLESTLLVKLSMLTVALVWLRALLEIAGQPGRKSSAGLVLLALLLASCAAGPNALVGSPTAEGVIAGFWRGLWHGAIAPITFLISLFSSSVHVYEVHNNGGWYDFGFVLGITSLHGGGAAARSARARPSKF
jgi:hypothetical protein